MRTLLLRILDLAGHGRQRDIPAHHHGPAYRFEAPEAPEQDPLRLLRSADERVARRLHRANQLDQLDAIVALLEDIRNLLMDRSTTL